MATPETDQVVKAIEAEYATELVRMLVANNDASVARAVVRLAVTLGAVAMSEVCERQQPQMLPVSDVELNLNDFGLGRR